MDDCGEGDEMGLVDRNINEEEEAMSGAKRWDSGWWVVVRGIRYWNNAKQMGKKKNNRKVKEKNKVQNRSNPKLTLTNPFQTCQTQPAYSSNHPSSIDPCYSRCTTPIQSPLLQHIITLLYPTHPLYGFRNLLSRSTPLTKRPRLREIDERVACFDKNDE